MEPLFRDRLWTSCEDFIPETSCEVCVTVDKINDSNFSAAETADCRALVSSSELPNEAGLGTR